MNQSQAGLLAIVIIVLIIAGAGIFFREDISKILNSVTSKPNSTQTSQISEEKNDIVNEPEKRVRAATFIDGFAIKVSNEKDLVKAFEEMYVFGKTFINDGKTTTGPQPITEIQIAIRNEKPADGRKPDYGEYTYVYYGTGTLQVNFVLTDEQLNNPQIGNDLLRNLYGAIYKVVYKAADDEVEMAVDKAMEILKNSNYIQIEKR